MTTDPHEERATIRKAWDAYMESIDAEYEQYERSIHQDGFWAAWQARGAYERERQREFLEEIRACLDCLYTDRTYEVSRLAPGTLTAHAGPISTIDRLVNAALASVPGATGEGTDMVPIDLGPGND